MAEFERAIFRVYERCLEGTHASTKIFCLFRTDVATKYSHLITMLHSLCPLFIQVVPHCMALCSFI